MNHLVKNFTINCYKWYQKAQKQVIFPNDKNQENHIQNNLIRLLTRLLFVWFLKEKKLINKGLFKLKELKTIINYDKDSSFYKAILQNLFFATLSTQQSERNFSSEKRGYKGWNKDFNNQYVFRYQELFKNPNQIKDYFNNTPFLNGGLFECLDDKKNGKYIDGFSRTKKHQPVITNDLFFNADKTGLINIFEQYQFTIEESTPLDVDVALDPELLGKVFENLLASYNPETKQQARKATGSFYTPREIVSYMVDESLKQYLMQKVPPHDNDNEFYKDRLNDLFNSADKIGELAKKSDGTAIIYNEEIPKLITAISQIKILDPAVGSGAYPMGLLQRMTVLLAILDPDNKLWQAQKLAELPDLSSIEKDIKITEKISNNKARQKAQQILQDKKQAIIKNFKNQNHNYLRKLYLIENCIYGVDIQPIAILIAQLRFFISLTVEQETNINKDNFGITPLPNLDYHFEIGNSLIGLPVQYRTENMPETVKNLLAEIKPLKHRFFIEDDHNEKDELRKQINSKTKQCYKNIANSINYLVDFDFKIDFNEVFTNQDGFDIVLGNPPYIRQESIKEFKPKFKDSYQVFTGTADIYTYFYEKGFNLLSNDGHLCYITSNKWMRAKYGEKLRQFFKQQTRLKQIIDFEGKQVFASATVDTNILLTSKTGNNQDFNYQKQLPNETNPLFTMAIEDLSDNAYTLQPPAILALKNKIEQIGTPLKEWDIKIYRGVLTGFNEAFIIDTAKKDELIAKDPKSAEIIKPILRGRDIKAYEHHWAGLWIITTFPVLKINIDNYPVVKKHLLSFGKDRLAQAGQKLPDGTKSRKKTGNKWFETQDQIGYYPEFAKEKLVYNDITQKLSFSLSKTEQYFNNTVYLIANNPNLYFQLSILNSNLIDWYYKKISAQLGDGAVRMFSIYMKELPIPQISKTAQQPFIDLANQILAGKKNNTDTTTLEAKIDNMVYKIYGLSDDEIAIIEDKK